MINPAFHVAASGRSGTDGARAGAGDAPTNRDRDAPAAPDGELRFELLFVALDVDRPRAWVASVDDGQCRWRALPRTTEVEVSFDPWWFESRCVHAAGKIYWHICNSPRMLALDPVTLRFSYLHGPRALAVDPITVCKVRVGETPDGRLCLVTDGEQQLHLWVRGEGRSSDNGWLLERRIVDLSALCDMIPGMPSDVEMIPGPRKPTDIEMVPCQAAGGRGFKCD